MHYPANLLLLKPPECWVNNYLLTKQFYWGANFLILFNLIQKLFILLHIVLLHKLLLWFINLLLLILLFVLLFVNELFLFSLLTWNSCINYLLLTNWVLLQLFNLLYCVLINFCEDARWLSTEFLEERVLCFKLWCI